MLTDPKPRDVDWPSLVAACERRGIPVLRADHRGDPHLIRTTTQLLTEWEPDEPSNTNTEGTAA